MKARTIAVAAATGCVLALAGSTAALADATDIGAANLANALDVASGTSIAVSANLSNDNLTCDVPTIGGSAVNQRTPYVIGEVYAHDAGVGKYTCVNLDRSSTFSVTASVNIQAYKSGRWVTVAFGAPSTFTSIDGVATVEPTVVGQYDEYSGALNAYHRAVIVYSTSTGRHGSLPSAATWFMTA